MKIITRGIVSVFLNYRFPLAVVIQSQKITLLWMILPQSWCLILPTLTIYCYEIFVILKYYFYVGWTSEIGQKDIEQVFMLSLLIDRWRAQFDTQNWVICHICLYEKCGQLTSLYLSFLVYLGMGLNLLNFNYKSQMRLQSPFYVNLIIYSIRIQV